MRTNHDVKLEQATTPKGSKLMQVASLLQELSYTDMMALGRAVQQRLPVLVSKADVVEAVLSAAAGIRPKDHG